jgi:bifunctional UDP-N-acetylglucosamine pyrophosphorylase/glucosamine-1-phosphate N-acetyltransferase
MILHVLNAVSRSDEIDRIVVVVGGQGREAVVETVSSSYPSAEFVDQPEQIGTGDAVRRCREILGDFEGTIVVLNGDGPFIRQETLDLLIREHARQGASVSLVTAKMDDPTGYGRIRRDAHGRVVEIIEEADVTQADSEIGEVNTGIWAFSPTPLWGALEEITSDNAQGEFYLPDAALVVASSSKALNTVSATDPQEVQGVNDRLQLAEASRQLRLRHLEKLAESGVTIEDPSTTFIEEGVEVGPDTLIRPSTFLEGSTRIGARCEIGPMTQIVDSEIADGATVTFSQVMSSKIGEGSSVGPFAYVRPGTELGADAKIGTFVETKKAQIGDGSKIPHLSYIGDAEIGERVNIGAGTITANYDSESKTKSKTKVGNDAFTSSNTVLRAPVSLGEGSGTGAGAVVTADVEDGEIVVGVPAKPLRKRKAKVEEGE